MRADWRVGEGAVDEQREGEVSARLLVGLPPQSAPDWPA